MESRTSDAIRHTCGIRPNKERMNPYNTHR